MGAVISAMFSIMTIGGAAFVALPVLAAAGMVAAIIYNVEMGA